MEVAHEVARDRNRDCGRPQREPSFAREPLNPILTLQQQVGNQAVQSLLRAGLVQAKLAISNPDDPEEREADQVADRIMRMHSGAPVSASCCCSRGGEMCDDCKHGNPALKRSALQDGPYEELSPSAGFLRSADRLGGNQLHRTSPKQCVEDYGCATCNEYLGIMEPKVDHEHCVGDCVKQHEQTHANDEASCCESYGRCIANAPIGQNPCRDAWDTYIRQISDWTECNAYNVEGQCLNKILTEKCRGGGTSSLGEACCNELQAQMDLVTKKIGEHCPQAVLTACPFKEDGSIWRPNSTPGQPTTGQESLSASDQPSPQMTTASRVGRRVSDPYQREADQVADRILRSHGGAPISSHCSCSSGEEMCEECKQKQQGAVARKAESAGDVNEASSTVPEVVRSAGQPLDSATRSFFEPRFGHDFSNVRLHTGSQAAESAHSIQALAYTAGHHIVFANGMYNPDTSEGRLLLGHELTHTIQQGAAKAVGTTNSRPDVQVQNKDFVQRQAGHTQTGPSAAEQKAIALRWTDHDIDFYHNTVAAVATSFGLSQAALWQPAHDPTFSFYRKYTTDHPRANAGDKILVTVSLNHWPGRVPEVTDFAMVDAAAPSPIPIAPPAQPLPQPAPPCPPCPESPRTQGCPECPPEPPVFLCNKPVPGHAVHRQGHLFLRVGGSGPGNPTFELEHDSKGDHCKCGFQGIPQRDYPEDRDATDADCIPAPTVTASCLAAKFSSYPVGMYCALGPNSNTYAHFLLNACGGTGLTPPGNVPGFNDSPPIAGTSNNTIDVRLLICDCTGCNECDSGVCKATGSTSQPDNPQPSVQTPIQRREDPNPSHAAQRMLPDRHLLALQQQAGNQAVQSLLRASLIQAKLAISQPDDPAEHEADQVADRIMRMHSGAPTSSPCSCSGSEEMCEECQKKQPAAVSRSASGVLQRQSTNPQPTPQTNPPLNQQNNPPTNQVTNPQASASSKPPQVWNSSLISAGVQQTALPYCYGESGGNSGLGTNQKTTPGPFSSACSHPCAYLPLPLRVQFHTDGVQGPRPGVNPGDKVARVSATVKFEPAGGGAEIVLLQNQGDATYVSPGHPLQTTFNTVLSNFTLPGPGQLIVSLINSDSAGQGLGIYSDTIHVDACPGVSKPGIPVPSTSVQLGKWLVVPDPDNAPLQYTVVDKNTPINGPGVMVQVEKDDKGYFYRYNGRRVDLPGNPPYPGAQVQPGQNQPAPTPPAPVESAPVQRSAQDAD
jgi:hypothetical protein